MSTRDFSEQIKALEEEGSKLLAATQMLSESFQMQNETRDSQTKDRSRPEASSGAAYNLSGLTDISAEQKTIDELAKQLDEQAKHAETLEKEFLLKKPNASDSGPHLFSGLDSTSGTTSTSERQQSGTEMNRFRTPSSELLSASAVDFKFPSEKSTQRHLSGRPNYQNEIDDLKARLKEVLSLAEQQKQQFNSTVESLKTQLNNALCGKDNLLGQNKMEHQSKDATLNRLQDTIAQLERANHLQEETLVDMNERLVSLQRDKNEGETCISKIKSMLYTRMGQYGKALFDRQSGVQHNLPSLVVNLEQCFEEYDKKLQDKDERIHGLVLDVENMKLSVGWKEEKQEKDYQHKLKRIQDDSWHQVEGIQVQLKRANDNTATLQKQIVALEQELASLAKERDDQIKTFQEKLFEATTQINNEKSSFAEKEKFVNNMAMIAVAYNKSLVQKEMAALKQKNEALQAECDGSQCVLNEAREKVKGLSEEVQRLTGELTQERQMARQSKEAERTMQFELKKLQDQLDSNADIMADLERDMDKIKRDGEQKLQKTINMYEEETKSKFHEEVDTLKSYIAEMREKSHHLELDLSVTKTEHRNLLERYQDTKDSFEKLSQEFERSNGEQKRLEMELEKRNAEMEAIQKGYSAGEIEFEVSKKELQRLQEVIEHYEEMKDNDMKQMQEVHEIELARKDKEIRKLEDRFSQESEDKYSDIKQLESLRGKLHKQLEEREATVWKMQQQLKVNEKKFKEMDNTMEHFNDEINAMRRIINEKEDEIRRKREEADAQLVKYEEQCRQFEQTATSATAQLNSLKSDNESLVKEQVSREKELAEMRQSISRLEDQNIALQKQLERKQGELGKEIARLTNRLHAAEHDVTLAKKIFKSKQKYEGRAASMAEDMQKEVTEKRGQIDSLQSRIRWLEECLDSALKEKTGIMAENEKASASMRQSRENTEKYYQQLKNAEKKIDELKEKISSLEGALEKAGEKYCDAQSTIEKSEQELTRMKLQHSLEVREMNWAGEGGPKAANSEINNPPSAAQSKSSRLTVKRSGSSSMSRASLSAIQSQKFKTNPSKENTAKPWAKESTTSTTMNIINSLRKKYGPEDIPTKDTGNFPKQYDAVVSKDVKGFLSEMKGLVELQAPPLPRAKFSPVNQFQYRETNPYRSMVSSYRTAPKPKYQPISGFQLGPSFEPSFPAQSFGRPGIPNIDVGSTGNYATNYKGFRSRTVEESSNDLPYPGPRETGTQQYASANPGVYASPSSGSKFSHTSVQQMERGGQGFTSSNDAKLRDEGGEVTASEPATPPAEPATASARHTPFQSNSDMEGVVSLSQGAMQPTQLSSHYLGKEKPRKLGEKERPQVQINDILDATTHSDHSADFRAQSGSKNTQPSFNGFTRYNKSDINQADNGAEFSMQQAFRAGSDAPMFKTPKNSIRSHDKKPHPELARKTSKSGIPPRPKSRYSKPELTETTGHHLVSSKTGNKATAESEQKAMQSHEVRHGGDAEKINSNTNNMNVRRSKSFSCDAGDDAISQNDLCRRLEQKLRNLNKLGDQLQSDNEGLATRMDEDGKKLANLKAQLRA